MRKLILTAIASILMIGSAHAKIDSKLHLAAVTTCVKWNMWVDNVETGERYKGEARLRAILLDSEIDRNNAERGWSNWIEMPDLKKVQAAMQIVGTDGLRCTL